MIEFDYKKELSSGAEPIQEGLNCSYTMASTVCRYNTRVNIVVRLTRRLSLKIKMKQVEEIMSLLSVG